MLKAGKLHGAMQIATAAWRTAPALHICGFSHRSHVINALVQALTVTENVDEAPYLLQAQVQTPTACEEADNPHGRCSGRLEAAADAKLQF